MLFKKIDICITNYELEHDFSSIQLKLAKMKASGYDSIINLFCEVPYIGCFGCVAL